MPAMLPRPFCTPTQRPAAVGPASVCEFEKLTAAQNPLKTLAANSNATDATGPAIAQSDMHSVMPSAPPIALDLRARSSGTPAATRRSQTQPAKIELAAYVR